VNAGQCLLEGNDVNAEAVRRLLKSQGYRCAMTGRVLTPETAALDHIVPRARGGISTIGNAQVVLAVVNQAKGTMTAEEFIQLCREVVSWTDRGITA